MFRRVMTVPLVSLSALLLVGGPAEAAPAVPGGTPQPLDLGQPCEFPIEILATANAAPRAVLPNGLVVVTGPAIATVTNTDTGKSKTYNISGPGKIDDLGDEDDTTNHFFLKGQNLISNLIDDENLDPFLITTSGNVSFFQGQPFDEPGLRGHISHDVCAELAP
jgi:hypothetical protein